MVNEIEDMEDDIHEEEEPEEVEQTEEPKEEEPEEESDESDEDREEIRARRREEKKRRKEKQRQHLQEVENRARSAEDLANRLAQEIEAIKNSGLTDKLDKYKADMGEAERVYKQAEKYYKDAMANNDAVKMVEAQRAMDIAESSYRGFESHHNDLSSKARQNNTQTPPALNQEGMSLRESWLRSNPDIYSALKSSSSTGKDVAMIDEMVYRSGYRPYTNAYWNELDRRLVLAGLKEKDGGKFESRTNRPKTSIVGSGTNGPAKSPNKDSIAGVTNAQIQAVKKHAPEIWEDPVKRASFLKTARDQNKQRGM